MSGVKLGGNSDSDNGFQSETGTETEAPSDLEVFMDDNGFESVNYTNELDETPLQFALNTENYAAVAILRENEANDKELFTQDTARVGLFEVGIEDDDLMLEGMSAPMGALSNQLTGIRYCYWRYSSVMLLTGNISRSILDFDEETEKGDQRSHYDE